MAITSNLVELDEKELVAAVLRKDRKATAEFVGLYADTIYSYVRHRLTPRTDLVEDLVQEVFLAAWTQLGSFRGESPLKAWLLGIARHKVKDYYRARLRESAAIEPDWPESAAELAVEPQMEHALDQERLFQKTKHVLEELPELYSLALLWRYWEQRSAQEMAAQTGRTEKAIERILARAREQFKRRWNGE